MLSSATVAIGMPVYNESKYIHKTIESILNQEFKDFSLIISDNASNDKTLDICKEYAAKDNRIKIIENTVNIGAGENFQQVFRESDSQYFVWISGHDLWHPQFLSKCVDGLNKNPSVVLFHSKCTWIDEQEKELGVIGRGIETRELDLVSRFHVVLWGMGYGSPIYGLLRSSTLNKMTLGTSAVGADNILLNELSLLGDIAYLDESLQYIRKLGDFGNWESYISKIFNRPLSELSGIDLFWSMTYEYLKIVYKHVPDPNTRHVLSTSVVNCLLTKYRWILSSLVSSGIQSSSGAISASEQRVNYVFNQLTQIGQNIESLWQDYHFSLAPGSRKLIAIDGVFFQLYSTGIARVWKSLLEEWANTEFGNHIVLLDRVGTAPKIEGISYYQIPAYDYNNTDADRQMLQQICNDLGAELFISTYYTTPIDTPSVFMAHDMIPELMAWNLNEPMWREKHYGIQNASAYISVSENTEKDLLKCFPDIAPELVTVARNGVNHQIFVPATPDNLDTFKTKYGITKPYFVLVGAGGGYKNSPLFFQAFNQLATSCGFDIICTGSSDVLSADLRACTAGSTVHMLQLSDKELALAYSGAISLVYPSKYEGFGMPIVEAMACGCPVITCPNASIPEVAGDAAIYVNDDDIDSMAAALCEVQKPQIRAALISKGLTQAQQFSWTKMGDIVKSVLIEQTLAHLQLGQDNLIIFPDWSQDEDELGEEIASVCYNLAQSSEYVGQRPAFGTRPTLLIDTTNAEDIESVNMLISGIAMNLMMGADIDITEHLEIALTGELATIQWQALLPKLHGKIKLGLEDVRSIESSGANLISEIPLTEALALALV
jgi:glycosyltransferase involved in cell wall biosynthesis